MVVCKPILSCKDEVKVSTLSTGDTLTTAWEVDDGALFSGAFVRNVIKNYSEVIEGQYLHIKRVLYQNPATIVFWSDGTKTVSKCSEKDTYSMETGLALCVLKKIIGTREVKALLQEWCSYESSAYGLKSVTVADVRKKYKE